MFINALPKKKKERERINGREKNLGKEEEIGEEEEKQSESRKKLSELSTDELMSFNT